MNCVFEIALHEWGLDACYIQQNKNKYLKPETKEFPCPYLICVYGENVLYKLIHFNLYIHVMFENEGTGEYKQVGNSHYDI
jgi:hypothetical protein